ncbi:hypothetical protein PCE1_001715 [Barthelona sp. PCE]
MQGLNDDISTMNENMFSPVDLMDSELMNTPQSPNSPFEDLLMLGDEKETNPRRIAQRNKQIEFGYQTVGYKNFINTVPREDRTEDHPVTPDPEVKMSKRAFDYVVRKWRRQLHEFDPPQEQTELLSQADDLIADLLGR